MPNMLAAIIDANERFVTFAANYLLIPNHKIAKNVQKGSFFGRRIRSAPLFLCHAVMI